MSTPSITEFRELTGYWVLYWIGRMTRDKQLQNFSIELCFVKLPNGLSDYTNFPALSENYSNTKRIHMSAAFAPNFIMGNIIKDGMFINAPYPLNERISVRIKKPSAYKGIPLKEITQGSRVQNFPIIHTYYNYFISIAEGENASLPEDIDLLIIPCFEIARRYFLKSDALSKKVFAGEIGDREIYYNEHPDGQTLLPENSPEKTYVLITKDMYDTDADHIARIKYNDVAKRAALQVFSSIYKETDPKKKTVDTFFPFDEKCKLEVLGKRFKIGDKNIFLVFNIKRCSVKLYPGILVYDRINDGRSADNREAREQSGTRIIRNNSVKNGEEVELTGTDKPNFQSPKEIFMFDPEDEYDNPPIKQKRLKEKQQTINSEPPTINNDDIDTFSTNSTTSGDKNTSKAGIETRSTEDAFKNFMDALQLLSENGYTFSYLYPKDKTSIYFNFPDDHLNEIAKRWCILRKSSNDLPEILRSCIIIELLNHDEYYYLIEIEPKYFTESFYTYLINDSDGGKIEESEILLILNELARNQGKVKGKRFESADRICCTRIEHTTVKVGEEKHRNPQYLLNALKRIL